MRNIKLKHYVELQETLEYETVLEYIKPAASITIGRLFSKQTKTMNINAMPYANVKYCVRLLQKLDTWDIVQQLFEICYDVKPDLFWNISVVDFYKAKNHLVSEFKRVIETEARVMVTQSTDEHLWQMAGSDKLKPYNDTLPLVQLGKQFGQYPFDIGRKPYSEVFSLLAQVKTQNDVESEYQKLKSQ